MPRYIGWLKIFMTALGIFLGLLLVCQKRHSQLSPPRDFISDKCRALLQGHSRSLTTLSALQNNTKSRAGISDETYIRLTLNCLLFKSTRSYIETSLSQEEHDFPIAYSMLVYKNVEQIERLLRAIYRPQNIYCIHVDEKAENSSFDAIRGIAGCFDNVFLTEKRVNVIWGEMSVLEPELMCLKQLWSSTVRWKYFINLTGQEFPLKTNYELVRILQAYNGANDVEGTIPRSYQNRWRMAGPPPHGIVAVKGAVHVVLSRRFVNFLLHDQRALDFLEWTRKTEIPDETYFSTLNHNPFLKAPGSYNGPPETDFTDRKPYLARFKTWSEGVNYRPCAGKWVRDICVFGTGDLPQLATRKELFANKFFLDYQHAFDCMEELIYSRTMEQYRGKYTFDASWYGTLGFVKNQN